MAFATRFLRLLPALLFALGFALSQEQAVLHLVGHDLSQLAQKKDAGDPQETLCAKCLAFAHLDHALAGTVPAFAPPQAPPVAPDGVVVARVDLAFVAGYRSRAPPAVS